MRNNILDDVNQRTQLAGNNRLELLLFRLNGSKQLYGINVFKVKEAIPCPRLTQIPYSHPVVLGACSIRGQTVSIYDLAKGIGKAGVADHNGDFVILTEYNRSVQGFLVSAVDKIINISWAEVLPPPAASGAANYMTAITKLDDQIVQIIDVEQVLADVLGITAEVSEDLAENFSAANQAQQLHILVADDSSVARNQIKRTLEQIGIGYTIVNNGQQALTQLEQWRDQGIDVADYLTMMISDIEMPEMDGYTLTAAIRKDPAMKDLKILLHTSMSGTFNEALVEKVGADRFIPKFSPDDLAKEVQSLVELWRKDQ